jgi:hypothetical protein
VKILLLASLMRPEREFLEHFLQASYIRSRYCRGVDKEAMEKVRSLRAVCSVGVLCTADGLDVGATKRDD